MKWKHTHSALPGSTRNIPTETAIGNGTSQKTAIFIEVFLSKTQANIGTTLPIQEMTLSNALTSIDCILTTAGFDSFFLSYQLSLLYTLTTYAGLDKHRKT